MTYLCIGVLCIGIVFFNMTTKNNIVEGVGTKISDGLKYARKGCIAKERQKMIRDVWDRPEHIMVVHAISILILQLTCKDYIMVKIVMQHKKFFNEQTRRVNIPLLFCIFYQYSAAHLRRLRRRFPRSFPCSLP